MSLTIWLVILVPLAIFAWLVAQAMPSPRDRQLGRLRARARTLDLQVSLRQLKDPDPDPASRVSGGGRVRDAKLDLAAYTAPLRLPAGVEKRHAPAWRVCRMRHHAQEQYDEGLPAGWRFDLAELPLREPVLAELAALLARAPEGTAALEASAREVTLCWRERGEADAVDEVAALLADVVAFQLARAAESAQRERAGAGAAAGEDLAGSD
ncbi:MAG: hypothetical protein V2J24_06000 [Pseudomonadales bacterium]|jgi:hypothetical protein|nr:hypothetical protein [Pseudomonadales bacterium]